jgi:uncharacterized protein (DUF58 family)
VPAVVRETVRNAPPAGAVTPPDSAPAAGPPATVVTGNGRAGHWKYLEPGDLRRLRNFQFAARLVVEGFYQGRHRSPYYDLSAEFADYRPYTPGDEIRAIDWRAFARTDRFYIKLFRKETDMNCYLLVDKSNSMSYRGEAPPSKLEYASYLAAAVAFLMVQQGDKASLALCDDAMRAFIPASGTWQNLQRILVTLERVSPGGPTRLSEALETLSGILKRRGLLVVISDFLDEIGPTFSALNMFAHRGYAILLFQVLTDAELNLPRVSNALFRDLESTATAAAEPDAIREAYQAEIQAFLGEMRANARARKMHYQLAVTSQPYHDALEAYLTARTRL